MQGGVGCDDGSASGGGGQYQGGILVWLGGEGKGWLTWYLTKVKPFDPGLLLWVGCGIFGPKEKMGMGLDGMDWV